VSADFAGYGLDLFARPRRDRDTRTMLRKR
jgi:hypothetical protein